MSSMRLVYPETMIPETVEASHIHFKELVADLEAFVRDNPGTTVVSASSEQHMLIAWMVHSAKESRLFSIRLRDLKVSKIDFRSPNAQLLMSKTGRAELAEAWAEGQTLDFGKRQGGG